MNPERDTILYVLTKSQEYLKSQGIPSPRLDAEVLLSDLLNIERIKLYSGFDKVLSEEQKNLYRERIRARGNFQPVAYITGKKNFYNSIFTVSPAVLIPRPETEELVEWVLKDNPGSGLNLLDIGTGSGCIGISLKKEKPDWTVHMSDISPESLEIAKKNSEEILKESLPFYQSDLFSQIPSEQKFDLIISNPPYIPISEKANLMRDVLEHEPATALFLQNEEEFFRRFLSESKNHLKSNGKIYLEIYQNFAQNLQAIAKELGFHDIVIKKDLSQKDRMMRLQYESVT